MIYLDKGLMNIFQNQIVTMNITGKDDMKFSSSPINRLANLFFNSLIVCQQLRHLKFYTSKPTGDGYISFGVHSPIFSSNLLELHIKVRLFDDCLFLLDGRLNQLRILFVTTVYILPIERTTISEVSFFGRESL